MSTLAPPRPLGVRAEVPLTAAQLAQFQAIADFDLGRVRARLLSQRKLDPAVVDDALWEFRRYLGLHVAEPRPLGMYSAEVDEVWHACVLITRLYADLCEQAFGHFLHHEPNDGLNPHPEWDWRTFAASYSRLYGEISPLWKERIGREDIEGLEAKLNSLAETLPPGEQAALARMLGLAVLGDRAEQGLPVA